MVKVQMEGIRMDPFVKNKWMYRYIDAQYTKIV